MAADTAVVPSLGRWGLSPDADLIYRTLSLLGPGSGSVLSRELGLTRARTDRGIEELLAAGAVRESGEGGERRWTPLEASRVLAVLGRHRGPVPVADQHRRHLVAVAGVHLDRLPAAGLRHLPTRAAARHRIADLVAGERREHLAINTEAAISREAARAAAPLDESLVRRGVRLRTLKLPALPDDRAGISPGGEHREADHLPLKLMIFDRGSALFPADPVRFEAGAIELTDPDAVAHLTQLFYRIWRTAVDPRKREVPTIVLTTRERAIVERLAAGFSEEAAAAALGLSRRTVVYAMRALMDRLGVENRFQLALVLGAARAAPMPPGWETP
jgi:DNA-binding CsgD family transcriptional regulator